jgi:aerobic carbon-monoxide dehydrogenase medium subunit
VIPAAIRYVRPGTLEEAFGALSDPEAKVLAGGQSLLPVLKLRVVRPSVLVDIGDVLASGAELQGGTLTISALTTWSDLAKLAELERPELAAVRDCAEVIGDLQVRNSGTVGGSLAHADPASDLPAVVLALGAELVLRSRDGERTIGPEEFVLGPFLTALAPGELLTEVRFARQPAGSGSAYEKIEHPASGFALAGAAALVTPDGRRVVAVNGVGAHAFLLGDGADPVASLADAEVYGDRFASAEYRRHLASVVARRAIERAKRRAKGAG